MPLTSSHHLTKLPAGTHRVSSQQGERGLCMFSKDWEVRWQHLEEVRSRSSLCLVRSPLFFLGKSFHLDKVLEGHMIPEQVKSNSCILSLRV